MARVLAGTLLGVFARAWLFTLRLRLVVDASVDLSVPLAFAFWHGQQFALLRWASHARMVALVSRSADGELVARALRVLGVGVARGSSSRGGVAGLRALVRRLRRGDHAAFAVDGPKGPARVVRLTSGRAGVSIAARLARTRVVPMAAACGRCHVFARAWDRFELPLPFTEVVVVLGAPLEVNLEPEALAHALDAARDAAERGLSRARICLA